MKICRKIKICGLSRPQDIKMANELKPDYIGLVFAPSRREVDAALAARLKTLLSKAIPAVGVFVNAPEAKVLALCEAGIIDIIQLHGDEGHDTIRRLKDRTPAPIIKAVRVSSVQAVLEADQSESDYLLLDTYVKDQYGGSGHPFDWSLIPPLSHPYFLAGGLDAGNMARAMETGAFCLDVSSGVEAGGYKDYGKVREAIGLVHGTCEMAGRYSAITET